jgi:hypothetical protein
LQRVQLNLIAILLIHAVLLPPIASASLGSDAASVYRDVEHVSGSVQAISGERYSVYEVRVPTGTIVREFVSPSGVVFAIAWQGPFIPELQHFLGKYFQEYADALHARKQISLDRRPVTIGLNDLVFENGGHVGAFSGRAYVPQAVPTGVVISELH